MNILKGLGFLLNKKWWCKNAIPYSMVAKAEVEYNVIDNGHFDQSN